MLWVLTNLTNLLKCFFPVLCQVKSIGERVVLYVLNRIIYRTQEMEKNETPFLCHGSSHFAKIMWKKGEAVGFYSVKPTGRTFERCRNWVVKGRR